MSNRSIKLADFITLQRGFDLPEQNRKHGTYPVIGSTSITGFHNEFKVEPPCVTTGRSGSLGTVLYITEKFWPLNTALWVKDFKGNHPRFVYYTLKSLDFSQFNSGAGVPTLNRNHLDNIEVQKFSVEDQIRISDFLGDFDDLIENYQNQIIRLEKLASGLYNEWFANFRFPDHEKVKMVDSGYPDFGMIPDGWKIQTYSATFDCRYGKNLPTSEISDIGKYPVYGAGGVIGRYNQRNSDDKVALITSRGNGSGDLSYTSGPSFVTNNSFLVAGKEEVVFWNYSWIYLHLNSVRVKQALGGAAQPQLTLDGLSNLPVVIPEKGLVESFQRISKVIFDLIITLKNQNTVLAKIRDLLLPKLISGEIDVSELLGIVPEDLTAKKSANAASERTRL